MANDAVEPHPNDEQRAREAYGEMVKLLTKKKASYMGGLRLGDERHDPLLGLNADDAGGFFYDVMRAPNRVLLVLGEEGTGKRFFGRLLQARMNWVRPDAEVVVRDCSRGEPWKFPGPVYGAKKGTPQHLTVLLARTIKDVSATCTFNNGMPEFPADPVLFLRGTYSEAEFGQYIAQNEREWLPRARVPKMAGYAEGLFVFGPWHWSLPLALVASTPEYEWLSKPAVPRVEVRA